MNPELDKIKDKIRKLIALASSPVEAEAKLAMQKAGELMAKYELSISEIRQAEGRDILDMIKNVTIDGIGEKRRGWESVLSLAIAKAFDSDIVLSSRWNDDEGCYQWTIVIIGHESDVDLVVYFHKFLRRYIWGMARMEYNTVKDRESYCLGVVATISDRLKEMYKKKEDVMDSTCTALVLVKKDAVAEKKHNMFPNLKYVNLTGNRRNWDAYDKGIKDGHDVNLARPIENTGREMRQVG